MLFALVWGASSARAELPAGLTLEVTTEDAERVRAEVERELSTLSPPPSGILHIRDDGSGHVVVRFEARDGRQLERTFEPRTEPAARAEEIALLAANVARDDVVPSPPPAPPSPGGAPVVIAPPVRVDACGRPASAWPVGADFVPGVGTSSSPSGRAAARHLSLNLLAGVAGGVRGVELGGLGNLQLGSVCGAQIAGVANVVRGSVAGVQIAGVVNVTRGDVAGAQIGVVNTAAVVRGVQIGVVNVAQRSDFSLGLLSVNTQGRTHLEAWINGESGLVAAGVKHGGRYWHAIYGVGSKLGTRDGGSADFAAMLGFGAHIPTPHPRLAVDIDGVYHFVHRFDDDDHAANWAQLRAPLQVRVLDWISVYGGATLNLMFGEREAPLRAPGFAQELGNLAVFRLEAWPGVVTGVSFLTDPMVTRARQK